MNTHTHTYSVRSLKIYWTKKEKSSRSQSPSGLMRGSVAASFLALWVWIRRSQWPSGVRRGSVAGRLLGLRVWIPPGAWMFVFCVCWKVKDWRNRQGNPDKGTNTDKVQRENKRINEKESEIRSAAWTSECCVFSSRYLRRADQLSRVFYRLRCVTVCDLQTSRRRRP